MAVRAHQDLDQAMQQYAQEVLGQEFVVTDWIVMLASQSIDSDGTNVTYYNWDCKSTLRHHVEGLLKVGKSMIKQYLKGVADD